MTSKRKKKRLRKRAEELTTDEVIETIFGKKTADELKKIASEIEPGKKV